MKKLISAILALILIISMTGCNGKNIKSNNSESVTSDINSNIQSEYDESSTLNSEITNVQSSNADAEISKSEVKNENYVRYIMIRDDETTDCSIAAKKNDGKYNVILDKICNGGIIGIKDGYLWYFSTDGIFRIALNCENPDPEKMMEAISEESSLPSCQKEHIIKACFIGDYIYFSYSSFAGGESQYDGIQRIELKQNNLADAEHIDKNVSIDMWYYNSENNCIYFVESSESDETLYLSDQNLNNKVLIEQHVKDFRVKNGKGLLLTDDTEQQLYILSALDLTSLERSKIKEYKYTEVYSGSLWGISDADKESVYYLSGTDIMKYTNGLSEIYDTYTPDDNTSYIYGFEYLEKGKLCIYLQNNGKIYWYNGKYYTEAPDDFYTIITLKNGSESRILPEKICDEVENVI
jgi:hypothetical protein